MAYNFTEISVLLVNDVSSTRKIMATALKMNRVKAVYEATEGNQAFRLFREHMPDVVITELNMNPMDGRWLARKIRAADSGSPNRRVPVILITGDAGSLSIPAIRDTGFDELLLVPFTVDSIADRVAYVMNNPRDFIDGPDYKGPDRRRLAAGADYDGPFRRAADPADKKPAIAAASGALPSAAEAASSTAELVAGWPDRDSAEDMLQTLFGHYVQHHQIVLQKLKLAQSATEASAADGTAPMQAAGAYALWREVITLFAKSGISSEEIAKIEGLMQTLPKDIDRHFKAKLSEDKALQDLEAKLDRTAYQAVLNEAGRLQAGPNPLSGLSPEQYRSAAQREEASVNEASASAVPAPRVKAFKFAPVAGKFKS